jgi:D-alanyl-D-alanine carboxypeptidase/D-alanyl-D-alanine-endopeptidase (penicillin-binding protein 4)
VALAAACALLGGAAQASASISRAHLEHGLAKQMHRVGGASGAWVYDLDASDHGQLFSWASKTPRPLASNSKLFTTAAVLHRFGAGGKLETTVYPQKHSDLHRHAIRGNLVLVGAGDPALASSGFAKHNNLPVTPLGELAKEVKQDGIKRVTGKVLADDSVFDRQRGVPTNGVDASGDLSPLSGLSYDSGFLHGHYAPSPELVAVRALTDKLRHFGVKVKKGTGRGGVSKSARKHRPLAKVDSPSISALITATNRPSNNFFAEMLLKRLAANGKHVGTTSRGAHKAERYARKLGAQVNMVNGSGLSRSNQASPKSVGHLLRAMDTRDDHAAFLNSLPLAGREGTLSDRMRGTPAEGRCRAKTGTLDAVSALSGYCRAGHGTVAFSILMSSVNVSTAQSAQDKMAALIARYRR